MTLAYSADLLALYAAAPITKLYRVHLFMIGPTRNGSFLYATDGRAPVTFNGNQYHPWLYGFWKRGTQTTKIGFDSNSIDCTVYSDESFQPIFFPGTGGLVYLMDGVYAGLLAGAPITIYRATMETYGTVVGPTGGSLVSTRFVGEIGEIKNLGPTKATAVARDLLYRLNLDCPQEIIQANCRWVLYSEGCTLTRATFTVTGAVASIIDPRTFVTSAHLTTVSPSGTFSQGILTFTAGKNNGISYAVSDWTPGLGSSPDTIRLDTPPLFTMTAGDAFTVTEGCNHNFTSCLNLQGDTDAPLNFGGTPFVPVPEAAV